MDVLDLLLKQQQKKKQKQKKNCDYSRDTIFEGIYRDDTTSFKTPPYLKFLNVFRRSSFPVKVSLLFLFCWLNYYQSLKMIYIQFSVFTKSLKTRLKLCKGWPSSQHNPTFSLSHFPSRIFAKCLVQLHVKETHFPFQFHDGVNYKWDWRNLNNTKIYIT